MEQQEEKLLEAINALLSLLPIIDSTADIAVKHTKFLRNSCICGKDIQKLIISHNGLLEFLQAALFFSADTESCSNYERVRLMLWQLVANCVVDNQETQQIVWSQFGNSIIHACVEPPYNRCTDIQLMIVYNILKGASGVVSDLEVLRCITRLWQGLIDKKCSENLEFLHFLFEYFLVNTERSSVRNYVQLEPLERIAFLDYTAIYLRKDSPNGIVSTVFMQYISKEFKMKSDCILRQSNKDLSNFYPREVYGMLRVIAAATGSTQYSSIYKTDHSLFLNVSSLLRCLVAIGRSEQSNIFTPLNKLEEVAVSSKISHEFEKELSFELKTLLVRCVSNMLYRNKVNKEYCLDTELIPVLLECTNMDARNPLIKEWSILAIRNACEDCPEIQNIIANLTNQGLVKNDTVKDLNLDLGSLRIK